MVILLSYFLWSVEFVKEPAVAQTPFRISNVALEPAVELTD